MKFLKVFIIANILIVGTAGENPQNQADKDPGGEDVTTEVSGDEEDEYYEGNENYDEDEDDGEDIGDDEDEGDVVGTEVEENEKLNATFYTDLRGNLENEIEKLKVDETNLTQKIEEEQEKNAKKNQTKIDLWNAQLRNVTATKEDYENFTSTIGPRLTFISQLNHFISEIKAVKNESEKMEEGDVDNTSLQDVVRNAESEMETMYLPVKKMIIKEMNFIKNLTKLNEDLRAANNKDKKAKIRNDIISLKEKLRSNKVKIDVKLKEPVYKNYKTIPRLTNKKEKFIIDEKALKIKYDNAKESDNETAKVISKLQLDLKTEKIDIVDLELDDLRNEIIKEKLREDNNESSHIISKLKKDNERLTKENLDLNIKLKEATSTASPNSSTSSPITTSSPTTTSSESSTSDTNSESSTSATSSESTSSSTKDDMSTQKGESDCVELQNENQKLKEEVDKLNNKTKALDGKVDTLTNQKDELYEKLANCGGGNDDQEQCNCDDSGALSTSMNIGSIKLTISIFILLKFTYLI